LLVTVSTPPTQAEMQAIADDLDEDDLETPKAEPIIVLVGGVT
jgi:hypothetical protein